MLAEASKPYFKMLQQWVCRGILDDPYKEFMIQEKSNITKDKVKDDFNDVYWEQRYTLHHHTVPSFLEPYKEKILLAGKYLNVLRECHIDANMEDTIDDLRMKTSALSFSEAVKVVDGSK
jgi:gamma-tubulin complex component 2